jgi:hypothetical protein
MRILPISVFDSLTPQFQLTRGPTTLQILRRRKQARKAAVSITSKIVEIEFVVICIKGIFGDIICAVFNDASLIQKTKQP